MVEDLFSIVLAYLCGSLLFARLACIWLKKPDVTAAVGDHNPGTTNAFQQGGFWCGVITLCGDLLKGFLPVYLYVHGEHTAALGLVIAAPVIGHIFPVFFGFHGGKGIATTFGCLLALPDFLPVGALALFFIFFSVGLQISPHYYRTIFTYLCTEATILLCGHNASYSVAFTMICAAVLFRLLHSKEEKKHLEVRLLWKH